ncbi:MAG TPA: putative glycolipid-binding domain-containing protein [Anaerolineae bacterium]
MATTNKGTVIAEGAYIYEHDDAPTGSEAWQLSKLAHGGLIYSSRVEMTAPRAETLSYSLEISQHWAPVQFTARIDAEGKTLTTEQRVVEGQWQARIEPHGGTLQEVVLDFSAKHEISFFSPVVLTPTLYRSNLQVGKSLELDTVTIDSVTLVPRATKQSYTCVAEEKINVPAGSYAAWHYTQGENKFWADRNGVVLLYQSATGDATKLARYRRIERR